MKFTHDIKSDFAIRADIKTKSHALEAKKARFADFVLTTLEESECWGPQTIQDIAEFAVELGLAKYGGTDEFLKV